MKHLFLLLPLAACNPQFWADPPAVKQPQGACAAAEQHLKDINCPHEANGFGGLCERSAARGVDMHPACVARIDRCDQFNDASRGCK